MEIKQILKYYSDNRGDRFLSSLEETKNKIYNKEIKIQCNILPKKQI